MILIPKKNDRAVLIATSAASSMVFIDTIAVNTILQAIRKSFTTGLTDIQWVVEIYVLFLGALSAFSSSPWLLSRGTSGFDVAADFDHEDCLV